MKFLKSYSVFEGLYSFNYNIPVKLTDKLVDFYLLTSFNSSSDDILNYQLEEAKKQLYTDLKYSILELTYKIIIDETEYFTEGMCDIYQLLKDTSKYNDLDFILNDKFKIFKERYNNDFLLPKFKYNVIQDESIIFSENDKLKNIEIASYLFNNDYWSSSFGGKAWYEIAEIWIKLYNTKDSDLINLQIYIDSMNSKEHNNGSIYLKIKDKYNILKILNLKFEKDSIEKLILICNSNIKLLILRLYKNTYGKTLEDNDFLLINNHIYNKKDLEKGKLNQVSINDLLIIQNKYKYKITNINFLYNGFDIITNKNGSESRNQNSIITIDNIIINNVQLINIFSIENTIFSKLEFTDLTSFSSGDIILVSTFVIEINLFFKKLKKIGIFNINGTDSMSINKLDLSNLEIIEKDFTISNFNVVRNIMISNLKKFNSITLNYITYFKKLIFPNKVVGDKLIVYHTDKDLDISNIDNIKNIKGEFISKQKRERL